MQVTYFFGAIMARVDRFASRFALGCAATAFLLLAVAPGAVFAQRGAESDEVDQSLRREGSTIKNWVKRPSSDPAAVKQFEDYFDRYYFPLMTQTTPMAMGDQAKLRQDLIGQYLAKADPQIKRKLTEKAYAFAEKVIRGRYHRTAKVNAVLLLGQLDETYSSSDPKPIAKANLFLCRVLELAMADRLPAYMHATALVGVNRHAQALDQLPSAQQKKMVELLMKATGQNAIAKETGPLTSDWLRGSAATGLAAAARKVDSPEIVSKLVALVSDSSLSLDTRATIAASLQGLSLPANGAAAKAVLGLAAEIGKDEATEAQKFEDLQLNVRGRRSRQSRSDSERYRFGDDRSTGVEYLRPGLVARLTALEEGLKAVAASAGDLAPSVQQAADAVATTLSTAKNSDSIDLDISAGVKLMSATLSSVAPSDPPPAAAPAAAAGDGDAPAEGAAPAAAPAGANPAAGAPPAGNEGPAEDEGESALLGG